MISFSFIVLLFLQRYFVLSESSTCFCVLRIYTKCVTTAWGPVPIGLRTSIPIFAIEAVAAVPTVASKGTEYERLCLLFSEYRF